MAIFDKMTLVTYYILKGGYLMGKRYMVIWSSAEDGSGSWFFDDLYKADAAKMDLECGLGYRCQMYEWKLATEENDYDGDYYVFLYE